MWEEGETRMRAILMRASDEEGMTGKSNYDNCELLYDQYNYSPSARDAFKGVCRRRRRRVA